jgi:signal transduction histidine kinase
MNPFGPSLRRRITLALAAAFVLGYPVIFAAQNTVFNVWRSFYSSYQPAACDGGFTIPWLSMSNGCAPTYSAATRVSILVLLAVVLVLVAWCCWIAAGRALRPLSATAETVRRLGPQNLGQRLRMTGPPDALKELADAIDDALDRLAAGYEGQRRFAANASHELRTPLAVQRLLTEVAMDDPATSQDLHRLGAQLLRTNERSEKLIEGLLVLAESDRGLPGKVPVRLDELAGSVLDAHLEMAGRHGVSLRRRLAERLVPGDRLLLERLVGNLVTNALAYNQPGGWVEVVVAGRTALIVRNSGERIPAEAVSSLFEPFRRLTADRTSHGGGGGLGLSIVRSIATAHGGTIQARPRPEGGLTVEIDLPGKPKPPMTLPSSLPTPLAGGGWG